tara:strand:+ start:2700 stop:3398 length:699 start_codon:yes stop_codon:yes gene_type:complete
MNRQNLTLEKQVSILKCLLKIHDIQAKHIHTSQSGENKTSWRWQKFNFKSQTDILTNLKGNGNFLKNSQAIQHPTFILYYNNKVKLKKAIKVLKQAGCFKFDETMLDFNSYSYKYSIYVMYKEPIVYLTDKETKFFIQALEDAMQGNNINNLLDAMAKVYFFLEYGECNDDGIRTITEKDFTLKGYFVAGEYEKNHLHIKVHNNMEFYDQLKTFTKTVFNEDILEKNLIITI